MKIDLERQVMDTMFLSHVIDHHKYLRMFEIEKISNVPKSTLERVLPRLVNRGWIEQKKAGSWTGQEPEGRIYRTKDSDDQIDEDISTDDIDTKILSVDNKSTNTPVFNLNEIGNEIQLKLKNLPSFQEKIYHVKHPYEKTKIFRKGRYQNYSKTIKKEMNKHIPKQYTFYRVVKYPFIKSGVRINLKLNDDPDWNLNDGKRFWKDAAKNLTKNIHSMKNS